MLLPETHFGFKSTHRGMEWKRVFLTFLDFWQFNYDVSQCRLIVVQSMCCLLSCMGWMSTSFPGLEVFSHPYFQYALSFSPFGTPRRQVFLLTESCKLSSLSLCSSDLVIPTVLSPTSPVSSSQWSVLWKFLLNSSIQLLCFSTLEFLFGSF